MDSNQSDHDGAGWPFASGEMAQRVREHEWAATPLGAVEHWPAALRTTVQLLLAHPFASIVLWGPQLIQIYNDAYRDLMGVKHPQGLGQPTRECWPEVWHINAPIYERVWRGESRVFEDALYPLARFGVLEDVWLSLTYSPVRDEAGRVAGVFITIIETTRRLRAEAALRQSQARQAFLLRLSDALRPLQDAQAIKLQATRLLGGQLDANRAFYAEVRGDDWLVVKGYEQGVTALPDGPYAARTYGPWIMAAYRAGERIVFHDIHTDSRFSPPQRQAHAAVQILGAVGVPLIKQGALVAILTVHSAVPRHWTDEEVALVEETAERTWAAVERARAEEALRQSEERLRLAMNVGELAAWDWDLVTGRIVWSREHFHMQGYAVGEVEPSYEAWLARVHPDDRAVVETALHQAREQREVYNHEFRTLLPGGAVRWVSAQGLFFHDVQGKPYRMIGVMRDITEQRNVREMLEHQIKERTQVLRQLLVRVEQVQDEERRRIARELHDGLGQYLTSISLALGMLRDAGDDARAGHELQRLHALMQQTDHELDRTVFLLRPTALEDGGLGEGVSSHVRTWSELTGVTVDLEILGLDHDRLPPQVEAAVFRVVQEALTNVAKHARATRVSLTLERRRAQLVGVIEDDGIGFEPQEASACVGHLAHWGVLGMQERIEALGGSFTIESHVGQGTSVLLRVPLS